SNERRRHTPVAAAPLDYMDGAAGGISARHGCQLQAAFNDAVVPLRLRVYSRCFAPDHPTDDPCVPSAAADVVPRGPTKEAAGRRAGPARGKPAAMLSNPDFETQADADRGDFC